ncbi:MAG: hypothetical protein AABX11_01680 [Nanoarchaeota archaeon]
MSDLINKVINVKNLASSRFDDFIENIRAILYGRRLTSRQDKVFREEYLRNRIEILEMHTDLIRDAALLERGSYLAPNYTNNVVREQSSHDKFIRQNYFRFLQEDSKQTLGYYEYCYQEFQDTLRTLFPLWPNMR